MLQIEKAHVHKLLCAQNPDAALLYLYIKNGNDPAEARNKLGYTETRLACAMATLRQLGLWPEEKRLTVAAGDAALSGAAKAAQGMRSRAAKRSRIRVHRFMIRPPFFNEAERSRNEPGPAFYPTVTFS